jgi:hypothetical protein
LTPGTAAAYLLRFDSVISSVCLADRRSSKSHFLTKTAAAVKKGRWSTVAEKDEISFEAFAVNDRSGFQGCEDRTF